MQHDIPALQHIVQTARTIAVYGFSSTPGKAAHDIPMYLLRAGYSVIGINPHTSAPVDGIPWYRTLAEVRERIDLLNVFRPSADAEGIVEEAVERHRTVGDVGCLWLQQGIVTVHGSRRCSEAGIDYVEDTCIYVIHRYGAG